MNSILRKEWPLKELAVMGLLVIFIAAPVTAILIEGFKSAEGWDLLAPVKMIARKQAWQPLLNTLLLGVLVVLGSTIVAFPVTFITAGTEIGNRRWLDVAIMIPFMTPPYIGSMGWILFLQPKGFLNQLLPWTLGWENHLFSLMGMVLIMSLHLFPFIYLILKNAMIRLNRNMDEAARIHGGYFLGRLFKITVPLLISSYVMGSLLVFVKAISEFGTPATFGRLVGFNVLTTEIHRYISSWPISFEKATSLSYYLLLSCLLIWYIQSILSRKYSYGTYGDKAGRSNSRSMSLPRKIFCWTIIGLILMAAIGIPYFSIISTSLIKLQGYGLQRGNFTLAHYGDVFSLGSKSLRAFLNSFKIALFTASFCSIIGTGVSLLIMRQNKRLSRMIDFLCQLPNTVPAIVLVIGLILFWNNPHNPTGLYNTVGMVVLTYIVFYIPFTVQYVKSSLSQLSGSLLEAGTVCGGSCFYNFRKLTFPLILPGIAAGWMMTFTITFRELVGALMILPPGMQTASTYIFNQFEQGEASQGMAMAVVSVLLTVFLLSFVNRIGSRQD